MRRWILSALGVLVLVALLGFAGYRRGFVRFAYPDQDRFPVSGIDVSHHQGEIDWRDVRRADKSFAFIKATEGADHNDARFLENWRAAGDAGIARGAYHFFTFCTSGSKQADHFLAIAPRSGELPLAVDVEFAGNCKKWESVAQIRRELRRFLDTVERKRGQRPVIYTTRDAYDRVVRERVSGYGLWIRSIIFTPSDDRYPEWAFWQYAGNGRVEGIHGLVDLNVFRGSSAQFRDLVRTSEAGPRHHRRRVGDAVHRYGQSSKSRSPFRVGRARSFTRTT